MPTTPGSRQARHRGVNLHLDLLIALPRSVHSIDGGFGSRHSARYFLYFPGGIACTSRESAPARRQRKRRHAVLSESDRGKAFPRATLRFVHCAPPPPACRNPELFAKAFCCHSNAPTPSALHALVQRHLQREAQKKLCGPEDSCLPEFTAPQRRDILPTLRSCAAFRFRHVPVLAGSRPSPPGYSRR